MSIITRLRGMFARPASVSPASDKPLAVPVLAVGEAPDWPAILRAAGFAQPVTWAASIAPAAQRRGINTKKRAAAFAATIAHESAGGARLVESLNYSVEGLLKTWPARFTQEQAERMGRGPLRQADQRAIGERAYGGRMGNGPEGTGDGFRYRGRGLIQLTGRDAYAKAGVALNLPLFEKPELAEEPNQAAEIAAWTWAAWKGCNQIADRGDVEAWRRAINGGTNGIEDVKRRYAAALAA
jgi:putative chitinase